MKLSEVREHSKKQVLKNGTQDFKRLENVLDKLNTIKIIDLYDAWIGDEGAIILAEALKYNTSITSIDLASTRMCDEGLIALSEALKVNKSIESINLSSNTFCYKGVMALAEALKSNSSITSIDLHNNSYISGDPEDYRDEGLIALSEALRINKTIQSINLISNEIGNEGAIALAEDFETNLIGSIEEREEIDVSGQDNGSLSWCLIL